MSRLPNNPSGQCPATLITGYRGLASTLIETFYSQNKPVSVLVRSEQALQSLTEKYPNAHFYLGDLVDRSTCAKWFENAIERFGNVGCLINNAALPGPVGKLHEQTIEDFDRTVQVNFVAPTYLCQLALSHWESTQFENGVLINLSGGGATRPRVRASAYATTKCALVRMTETLALEYPQHGIYAISPGALMTPMIQAILDMDPKLVGDEDYSEAVTRSKQGGEDPQKAADLALWLATERPDQLRGKLISAIWDDYKNYPNYPNEVGWWTLRRVDEVCEKHLKSV